MRQIAMLAHYVATTGNDGLQIHQYIATTIEADLNDERSVKVRLETNYPWEGQVKLVIEETDGSPWELALRIPGWCQEATVQIGNEVSDLSASRGDYARINRVWQPGDVVQLNLLLQPRFVEPNPRVDAIRGSLAIERGPLVYCLEAVDQPAGVDLLDVRIDPGTPLQAMWRADMLGGVVVIEGQGTVVDMSRWGEALYRSLTTERLPQQAVKLRAVPYYAWANRGSGQMRVWIPR
jgi:hypothetical protein